METFLSIKTFCARYGVGRTRAYELLNAGHIEGRKLGGRTLIVAAAAQAWADALPKFIAKGAVVYLAANDNGSP